MVLPHFLAWEKEGLEIFKTKDSTLHKVFACRLPGFEPKYQQEIGNCVFNGFYFCES